MPSLLKRAAIALKALRQLGLDQVGQYAIYRLTLETGRLETRTHLDVERALRSAPAAFALRPLLCLPDAQDVRSLVGDRGISSLLAEAGDIAAGNTVRLFGGEPVPLDLAQGTSTLNWTAYARGRASYPVPDVKFLWEPARFGWAFILGRAYLLSGDERYAEAFWKHAVRFLDSHPPNLGPQWVSAQEVALRILAFTWAAQVFAASPHTTPEVLTALGSAVAACAARIPATLSYSRAQNNNHLLSEAVGLLTAGLALPDHPQSSSWTSLGWHWLNRSLLDQLSPDGTYVQHSTSYHRLVLQLALWVHAINRSQARTISPPVFERLAAATSWLLALLDRPSGCVPNLGPNDGANILPLATCPHADYRPVLQAAARAFLGEPCLPPGEWDEMSLWLGQPGEPIQARHASPSEATSTTPHVLHSPSSTSWAYLRAARFTSRPGHADQLHMDLWWRGMNIAQDAGTYLYSAPPPWDNSLTHTAVHNTLTIDDQEQMRRAGRFLYLDWAQAEVTHREGAHDGAWERITALHNGYRRLGLIHMRTVTALRDGTWQVDDLLEPVGLPQKRRCRLHWLTPDWPWQVAGQSEKGCSIDLESPLGIIRLHMEISASSSSARITSLGIVRAGEVLHGRPAALPNWGWTSPTYGTRLPALSLSCEVEDVLPLTLTSRWILPSGSSQDRK